MNLLNKKFVETCGSDRRLSTAEMEKEGEFYRQIYV